MKKFALILSLVGMVGCQSGKQVVPPKTVPSPPNENFSYPACISRMCLVLDRSVYQDAYDMRLPDGYMIVQDDRKLVVISAKGLDKHFSDDLPETKSGEKAK